MAGPKITLYVDIVSPFAYLAYYYLRVSPDRFGEVLFAFNWGSKLPGRIHSWSCLLSVAWRY